MSSTREIDEFAAALQSITGAVCKIMTLKINCYAKGMRALARICTAGATVAPPPSLVVKGAKVTTKGGIHGTVTEVDAHWATVEIAKNVAVRVRPSHLELEVEPKKAS
jgi:Preprotein translocase subunit